MTSLLSETANKWFAALLPTLPIEIERVLHRIHDDGNTCSEDSSVRLWRWLRFQLSQIDHQPKQVDDSPAFVHWHFGFNDPHFRNRLAAATEALLTVEAAHYSLSSWNSLSEWITAGSGQLQLFNPLNWIDPAPPLHWSVWPDADGKIAVDAGGTSITLSAAQFILYEKEPLNPEPEQAAERMRAYYLPAALDTHVSLQVGMVSGRPLPVAAWTNHGNSPELSDKLREADSASTSPLLWKIGRSAKSHLKAALLKRSSILLFAGRVPSAGSYSREACPLVRIVLATTVRPRALRWGEVPAQWRTVEVGPSLGEWFGLPASRSLTYGTHHFYGTSVPDQDQQLSKLITEYTAIQNAENQRRAAADDSDFLAPLPWNLLHWIRDQASAEAVFQHKVKELVSLDPEPKRQLTELLRHITCLLADLQPLWQELESLPTAEPAYVVVPIHIARPAYLPGWVSLTRDLRTQRLPTLAHLTFISLSELKRTAEHPDWPVYVTTVEPRYWWALRQLPALTDLRWRLYRPLLHNSFCNALHQHHERESTELYRQLLPLTALAADPLQAVAEIEADIRNTVTGLDLPDHTPPARFQRVSDDHEVQFAEPSVSSTSTTMATYHRRTYPLAPVGWPDISTAELEAAEKIGALSEEPSWLEMDETVFTAPTTVRLADDELDQLENWEQAEEEAAVTEAECAADASSIFPATPPVSFTSQLSRRIAVHVTRHRLVWRLHPTQPGTFIRCQLDQVPIGSFYINEQELRRLLKQVAVTQPRTVPANGLPFWKQALRDVVRTENWNQPEKLFNKMSRGNYGGIRLTVKYSTFLRHYLVWSERPHSASYETRIPGSYQDRAVVAQVIGSSQGEQDEMQLLGWELATGRVLTSIEGQQLRQKLQMARHALLVWWRQRLGRHEEIELTEAELKQELTIYVAANANRFAPAFIQQSGKALGEVVSDYFLGLLLAAVQKKN